MVAWLPQRRAARLPRARAATALAIPPLARNALPRGAPVSAPTSIDLMGRFWLIVYGVTAAAHLPFALALAALLTRASGPRAALLALPISALLVWLLRGRVERVKHDRALSRARLLLLEEPYYVHWCAALVSVPLSLLIAPALLAASLAGARFARGPQLGDIAAAAYLGGLALSFYGVVVRRRWVRVRTIDVVVPGLGAAFDGYRIAQLSDLHIGGLWPRARAERWARLANRLEVDLIALTGDYVTSGTAFHADIAAVLTSLRARDGVIAVMGNHDYFGEGEPLLTLLAEGGVSVLHNRSLRLSRGEDGLVIAGVDDTYTRRADVALALAGRRAGEPLIVLAHDPQLFPELARGGADLVLSGHTHGGQLALPFAAERLNLARLSYLHHAGLYRIGASWLYVHPGLGTTGPPVRIGAAPEITVLRLRRGEGVAGRAECSGGAAARA